MEPGIREHKTASLRVSFAECLPEDMREGTREIVSLKSDAQGKGLATTLLWSVCHEADMEKKVLILQPLQFGEGMTSEQLAVWYAGFGFQQIQTDPVVLMARIPRVRKMVTQ